MNLRHRPAYDAPARYAAPLRRPGRRALQALGIVELAMEDHGGAVRRRDRRRRDALRPLDASPAPRAGGRLLPRGLAAVDRTPGDG